MSFRYSLLIAAAVVAACATPAGAQFDTIFGTPPRPPGTVPGRPVQAPPPQQFPQQPPQPAPTSLPQNPPPGAIQTQPLPPPPGATQVTPPPAPPNNAGVPPAQRQPRGAPPPPADTSPQPGDVVVAEPPAQKVPNATAVFAGLDKITGRITTFDVAVNETVQFGALRVTPRACYTRPPTEPANTDGFVEVDELTLQGQVRRLFTGWMFAASPGLNAVEHPIYDVWLTDCKSPAVAAAAPPEPAPTPAPAARPPAQQRPRTTTPPAQRPPARPAPAAPQPPQ